MEQTALHSNNHFLEEEQLTFKQTISIYVDQVSERMIYTFDFVFKSQNVDYQFINDAVFFRQTTGAKFNYSEQVFEGILQIVPSTLLFEESIFEHAIDVKTFENEQCFSINGIIDPFAAIFFVLARMEEYLSKKSRDEHDRYFAKSSYQYQYQLLDKLICDRLNKAIINYLNKAGVLHEPFQKQQLNIRPTFDIDNSYAYLNKDGIRQLMATLKDVVKGNKYRRIERKQVLAKVIQDPYDTFHSIESISERFEVNLFWLLGNFGQFDRNISSNDPRHQRLIRRMSQSCTVGIHPSYASNNLPNQLQVETERLASITGEKTIHSRQHFLKVKLPYTYHQLIAAGIQHEYSMGYPSEVGFKAGTLRAFQWFDLTKNSITNLTIHPFAYMDGTLLEYKHWSIQEAKKHIQILFDEAKEFGGDFYFLWHNETIGDYGKWKGWSEVLNFTLSLNKLKQHDE